MLFSNLPNEVFSPLAGKAKHLYADILLDLFDHFFSDEAAIAPPVQSDLVDRIATYAAGRLHEIALPDEGHLEDGAPGAAMAKYPNQVYYHLRNCGWLDEIREGYRVLVDMPPEIILLLSALQRIKDGAARNYTGAVTSIFASVDDAYNYPSERGAALAEAARQTKDLIHHLRAMTASLRRLEERVVRQPDPANVFRRFFEDFVGDFIVDQYKTLLTRNNPWRHRSDIIRLCEELIEDSHKVAVLSDVFQQTENLPTLDLARERVLGCLQTIRAAFDGIDPLRDTIDQFKSRVERRAVNTVRYMERIDREDVNRLIVAIQKISATEDDSSAAAPLALDLMSDPRPIGDAFLMKPRRKIVRRQPGIRTKAPVDPALKRRKEAKMAFQRSLRPTTAMIEGFLSRISTTGDTAVPGATINIAHLDDFVAFDFLRRLSPAAAKRFGIEVIRRDAPPVTNPWISCAGFTIKRTGAIPGKEDSDAQGS